MSYTKGPWEVGIERESSLTIVGPQTTYIATIMDKRGWGLIPQDNARLIAAAPALLDACKAFVTAWEECLQLEKTDVALRLAKDAIATATGDE